MKNFQARQGDVYLEQVAELPKGLKAIQGRDYIALGEATGHAHQLEVDLTQGAVLFEDDKGNLWVKVDKATDLRHEEHSTITLEPGVYKTTIQKEFDPWEGLRNVAD